jgi:hypothetical protein
MGCNFYLKKKDESMWNLPEHSSGSYIEALLVKQYELGESAIGLDLNQCVVQRDELHIGKSSAGWHFSLCIYPALGIYNLNDWIKLFDDEAYYIVSEEEEILSKEEMLERITQRKAYRYDDFETLEAYEQHCVDAINDFEEITKDMSISNVARHYNNYDEYLKSMGCIRGKNGLLAHQSTMWDARNDEAWKGFIPMITVYINTDGTYDLTPNWDFS